MTTTGFRNVFVSKANTVSVKQYQLQKYAILNDLTTVS